MQRRFRFLFCWVFKEALALRGQRSPRGPTGVRTLTEDQNLASISTGAATEEGTWLFHTDLVTWEFDALRSSTSVPLPGVNETLACETQLYNTFPISIGEELFWGTERNRALQVCTNKTSISHWRVYGPNRCK